MTKNPGRMSMGGSAPDEKRRIWTVYDEEYRVLLPFIKDGCDARDQVVTVVNPDPYSDQLQGATTGINTPATALHHDLFFVSPEQFVPAFREPQTKRSETEV